MKKYLQKSYYRYWINLPALLLLSWMLPFTILLSETNVPPPPAEEETSHEKSKESTDHLNSVHFMTQGAAVSGDRAHFMQRLQTSKDFLGGIQSFFFSKELDKKTTELIEGRGLFDAHDYELKLEINRSDLGSVKTGYKEFRTWYDGSGGFFPGNGQWFSLYDEELAVDRGNAWFESVLTLPDLPIFTLRYDYDFRNGMKDSLSWGDTNLTGGFGARGIVPSFYDLNEQRHTFALDMTHTIEPTTFGTGISYELMNNNNSRNMRRRPYETGFDRSITHREITEVGLFNAHAFTETWLNPKLLFTTGYSFTTLDSELGGNRVYGVGYNAPYDALLANRQARDEGFRDMSGGSQSKQYVMNLNLMNISMNDLSLIAALRAEQLDIDSVSGHIETDFSATKVASQILQDSASSDSVLNISQSLEARYTGFQNWVFYMRGGWDEGNGTQTENLTQTETSTLVLHRDTDLNKFNQKYTAGSNWYPHKQVNFAAQYYHKIVSNSYVHRNDSTSNFTGGNRYPAFIKFNGFDTDDVNFRITWRPLNNITSVSRYDYQLSAIDSQGDGINQIQSASTTSHIVGQSITWSPLARIYFQGNANLVFNATDTPAQQLDRAAGNLVLQSKNNYWNTSFTTGYALDDKTDLNAQYSYYRADDFSDNSISSLPYGANAEEHGVTIGMLRRITDVIRWNLKYGFFKERDNTSGGHNNFDAHLVYTSLQMEF